MAKAGIAKTLPTLFNVKAYGAVGDGVISGDALVSGTDNTAAIQAAVDDAAAVRGTVYFPPGIFRHDGQIDLQHKNGISLIGPSQAVPWLFNPDVQPMGSVLIYTGSGTTPGWEGSSLTGAYFSGLEFCYSNPGFTGSLMRFRKTGLEPAGSGCFEHCRFSSITAALYSAKCLVSLQFAIGFTFFDCYFYGGQWLVRGVEGEAGQAEACNSNSILTCKMQGGRVGFIANFTDYCVVNNTCMEPFPFPDGEVPQCVLGGDVAGINCSFDYSYNQHWDANSANCTPIKQPSNQLWDATIDRNFFDSSFFSPAKYMDFQGTGYIQVTRNIFQGNNSGRTLIDLGPSKRLAVVKHNTWFVDSPSTLIANTTGHTVADIDKNASMG